MARYKSNALKKEELDMATPMQGLASMPTVTLPETSSSMQQHISTPARKHKTEITLAFLAFLAMWYAFSPFLPETLKQFLWAILR